MIFEQQVRRLGLAHTDADTVPLERPDEHPGPSGALRERRRGVAQREPDEVGLAVRDRPALSPETGQEPCPLGDDRVDPGHELGRRAQRREGRQLADVGHAERGGGRPDARREARPRHRVAHPQTGQAERLRERAQQDHVRVLREHGQTVGGLRVADELDVRLVEHDQHVLGHRREERGQLVGVHRRARRVVRRAHQHGPGPRGHRRRHRLEVEPPVVAHRHAHALRAGQRDRDRVRLERPPRHDDLVVRPAHRGEHVPAARRPTRTLPRRSRPRRRATTRWPPSAPWRTCPGTG